MILAREADRRHDAMEECPSVYGGLVWSLSLRMSATREDAEEGVQEIFIDVWKYAERFDPARSSEATFIATIARLGEDALRFTRRQSDPVVEPAGRYENIDYRRSTAGNAAQPRE
jgi:DNA-directed RNA polymerase specialized sigma24 family protein